MKPERSGIIRVKAVAKNILLGSPGTNFMHMKVKVFRSERLFNIFDK